MLLDHSRGRELAGDAMPDDERLRLVKELLFDYVKSPSLRHIRDPHALVKLAREIVRQIDLGNSVWKNGAARVSMW